jgi:hypothetical protein
MRFNRQFAAVALATLAAACGGGSNTPPVIIDAPDEEDAPVNNLCPLAAELPGLGLGPEMGDCNGAANCTNDWFETPDAGPNNGVNTFFVIANLDQVPEADGDPATPGSNVIALEYVSTAGVFAAQNRPFNTTPTIMAGTLAFCTAQSGCMAMEAYNSAAYMLGKVQMDGSFSHLYQAGSGSFNVTAINAADGSSIKATVDATAFREVDGVDVIAGGCTSNLPGLALNLTQMADQAKRSDPNKTRWQNMIKNLRAKLEKRN